MPSRVQHIVSDLRNSSGDTLPCQLDHAGDPPPHDDQRVRLGVAMQRGLI
jgi:hypothetical protein